MPTLTIPPAPQPAEPQPAEPQPEAPQAEDPQAAASEVQPADPQANPTPDEPQQPAAPAPGMGDAAPLPPAQPAVPAAKTSSGANLFGQLAKGIMDGVKSAARTVSNAGKRVSDRISSDQQQRKDSIPVFFDKSGKAYVVADPLLQTSTGRFYSANGNDQTMILRLDDRIFNNAARSNANLEKRVLALQKCRFDGAVDGQPAFIWPTELLRNSQREFVGYTLPRIPDFFPFEALWTDCAPGQKFSQYTLKQRCGVAFRLAYMVDMANKHGLYVYDFTPQYLALLPKGYTAFIRTDTFCYPTAPGQHAAPFTAPLRYLPPEHLTAFSKHKPVTCSSKTDAFSLAVIIYMILSKGQHPFDRGNSNDIPQNIVAGFSVRPQRPFPPEVDKLFQAAFGYSQTNACQPSVIDSRPSAADWMRVLLEAFNSLPS